ncbi:MAG: hypothetical protein Q4E35_02425 [Eubacteriales bacterium]|nr:hypothetical protein [Eubacteriales bacterium]
MEKTVEFLTKHGMSPELIDPSVYAEKMRRDMVCGLRGEKSSMPMIPTYIEFDGSIEPGQSVIVIDAGGTNFRCGLAEFTPDGCNLSYVEKYTMPGFDYSVTWDEFISFTADKIQSLTDKTDYIGFCFSYNAEITPEIDGRVRRIDKEVVITESFGELVGASLSRELERRGIPGKRVFVLNDTVAALLGSAYMLDKTKYGGFIGQITGTGANTCCVVPVERIAKLHSDREGTMIVNMESGLYDGFPQGEFDKILDSQSNNPGEKQLEKMVSGAYLGELGRLALTAAAGEGYISEKAGKKLSALGRFDTSVIDAWASGEKLETLTDDDDEKEFVKAICRALFSRSARCMCSTLLGIMLLNDIGGERDKPVCICAEGSLVDKSRFFRPYLLDCLREYGEKKLGRYAVMQIGYETTLPGSAAAAVLNKSNKKR